MGLWVSCHRTLISSFLAAAVGALAWSGQTAPLSMSFVFLVVFIVQSDRRAAYAVALSYYVGSSWPLVPGARAFFGADSSFFGGVLLWLAASALLASPWGLFHFTNWPARFWSVPLALSATALPPLAIIGWASPLTSAGILFPGTGWLGIIALVLLPATIVRRPRLGVTAAVALAAIGNWVHPGNVPPPAGWEAVGTTFGRSELEVPDPIREFQNAEWIKLHALSSSANVIIFPETAIPRWNDAAELFWEPTLEEFTNSGKTIIIGTTVIDDRTRSPANTVIIRGAGGPASFSQRIPPPISMWRPFSSSGFPLRFAGVSTTRLCEERAAFLICYELLLTWPVLRASLDHPTILIGVANDYWANHTPIPAVQRAALTAWARLFSLPSLMATNT
jgi:hypothetical protein